MILTRVPIDRYNRKTLKALSSPNLFHGAVESSFEGERKRNLWRIDNLNGQMYLLLLSETKPDLDSFCSQFGDEKCVPESANYDKLLDRIKAGDRFRFRLTANPTKSVKSGGGERGKVCAHITTDHQKKWLEEKAETNGFFVTENSFDVTESRWYRFKKKNVKGVTLLSVTYEGILEVKDADLFRNALVHGIGREKAYGMGMLTVMSIK
jgi:CRISPR system Cascade subunit CasE